MQPPDAFMVPLENIFASACYFFDMKWKIEFPLLIQFGDMLLVAVLTTCSPFY